MKKLFPLLSISIVMLISLTFCSISANGKQLSNEVIYIDSIPVKTSTEIFWKIFKTGNTHRLSELIDNNTILHVTLKHSISSDESSSFTFNGSKAIKKWIKKLHKPDKNGLIWGGSAFIENSDNRLISMCDKLSCTFNGAISHNSLFLNKVSFKINSNGQYILDRIEIIDGD